MVQTGALSPPNIEWFHSFRFEDGLEISGHKPFARLNAEAELVFKFPVDGKSVLEIGAWDGFFSFEAEKRGALRVLATDHFCWSGPGWGTKAGFDFVHGKLKSKVASADVDVFDISTNRFGSFDIVLFLGVLYHLKNPLGGLEVVYAMTNECAVIETYVDMLDLSAPVMRFYLGKELNNDPTNFWAPNLLCLKNMLLEVGFKSFSFFSVDAELMNDARLVDSGGHNLTSGRVVVHAWK
jgi:tRNA (mo5U34)-methyltransferase